MGPEIEQASALPYSVLDLRYLLTVFPIRDRLLRLIFPYDMHALFSATDLDLTAAEADYYSRFWYDDAGVSFVSRTSTASLMNYTYSLPHYYGLDVITAMPEATIAWLAIDEVECSQPFTRQLSIEGQASIGSIIFVIEMSGNCFDLSFIANTKPLISVQVWLSHDSSEQPMRTKTLSWIFSDTRGQKRAIEEVLNELRFVLRYMYGQKSHGLFSHAIVSAADTHLL